MSSQKRDREYDDDGTEEDLAGGGYRGLGAAESPHRNYDDDNDPQTEDDDEEMRDLEDSDDDDLAFFGGGPVSSDSVSDSWMSAALLEAQQELSNALEPLGSLAVAWATPSGDLSAGFIRVDFNLLLLSTSFDRRAADCLGLRLERPLRVTLSFDAPHGTTTPDPLVPLEVECSQPAPSDIKAEQEDSRLFPSFGCKVYVPDIVNGFFRADERRLLPVAAGVNFLVALSLEVRAALEAACARCPVCLRAHHAAALGVARQGSESLEPEPPPVGLRMRPCKRDTCLYKWEEEAHFGTVLAELRGNPLAMHAELLWATCAAMSANCAKVLEPFPSFLLKKQQMRARAGQFDSGIARTEPRSYAASRAAAQGDLASSSTSEEAANKRLRTLAFLLRNLPPLSEMSAARSEGELVRKLDEKWRQLTGVKPSGSGGSSSSDAAAAAAAKPSGGATSEWQQVVSTDGWPAQEAGGSSSAASGQGTSRPGSALGDDEAALRREGAHGLLYRALRYVVRSNRLTLHPMVGDDQLSQVTAKLQFAVLSADPERERLFRERRQQKGSFFAFHGAPADCWYSIVRNSLRNLSSSSLQRHGASYGQGVYLAANSTLSLGYSHNHATTSFSTHDQAAPVGAGDMTLALVECIDEPSYYRMQGQATAPQPGQGGGAGGAAAQRPALYVVPNEADVVVRYLFIGVQRAVSVFAHDVPAADHFARITAAAADARRDEREEIVEAWRATVATPVPPPPRRDETDEQIAQAIALSLAEAGGGGGGGGGGSGGSDDGGSDDGDDYDDDGDDDVWNDADANNGASDDDDVGGGAEAAGPSGEGGATEALALQAFAGGGGGAATKLVAKEYMRLARLSQAGQTEGIEVELPDDGNVCRWAVRITPPEGSTLGGELAAYATKHGEPNAVQLEVLFTPGFPNEPPFVRVIKPRFAFHTGHVTVGGSICTELLTSAGWSPAYSLESVLVQLRATILIDGRLDPRQPEVPYGEQEARQAFERVARQHGWMK